MRRAALGLISLALVVGGVVALYMEGGLSGEESAAASVAIRAGVLLGAIWLAMPQLAKLIQRFPPWLMVGVGVGLLLLVVRPRLITYVVPLLLVLAALNYMSRLFRPLPSKRSATPKSTPVPREDRERSS